VVLTHYPVVNKVGEVIASAVTNLDLHDIARAVRTFGVRTFFVVTPLADQQVLVRRIISHWTAGGGGRHNPDRKEALGGVVVLDTIEDAIQHVQQASGSRPVVVATRAARCDGSVSYGRMRQMVESGKPHVLLFGTAWGLSEAVIQEADYLLDPISGPTEYNHLSVRSAVSIILDRLIGEEA